MNKNLFALVCVFFLGSYCCAQPSWQWGKRGGSPTSSGMGGYDETVIDLATDTRGNVYALSNVWTPGLDIDGHSRSGWGGSDIVLTSFKCDGTYRWSKMVGGHQNDYAVGVKTDTLGGVYITGYLNGATSSLFIDTDSSWAAGIPTTLFLMKFDTAGAYKWYRLPQSDTVTGISSENCGNWDMDVDGAGNIYWFLTLAPGAYAGGAYVVAANSQHVLRYDPYGNFVSGVKLQFDIVGAGDPALRMKRDHNSGRFYVTGDPPSSTTLTFGSTVITHTLYLGCFNSSGTLAWVKQNTNNFSNGPLSRAAVDAAGNIYVTTSAVDGDTFLTYRVNNPGEVNGTAMLAKIDPSGSLIWGSTAQANTEIFPYMLALSGSDVAVTGIYPAKLKWGTDSLRRPAGCLYSPFVARLDAASGTVVNLDSLDGGCGDYTNAQVITADRLGNIYIGGNFASSVTVAGTTMYAVGGGSDLFVAKYGTSNCSLTTLASEAIPTTSKELRVYPNPTANELTIENAGAGSAVKLYNIIGQQVFLTNINTHKEVINIGYLKTGTYLLQLTDSSGNRTIKTIVKQ